MANCAVCGKGNHYGIKVSHSHRRSNRVWKSNIKRVSCKVNGVPQKLYVCASCLRSGKVEGLVSKYKDRCMTVLFCAAISRKTTDRKQAWFRQSAEPQQPATYKNMISIPIPIQNNVYPHTRFIFPPKSIYHF